LPGYKFLLKQVLPLTGQMNSLCSVGYRYTAPNGADEFAVLRWLPICCP